jgi:MoxR-like ATPase
MSTPNNVNININININISVEVDNIKEILKKIIDNIEKVILGKKDAVESMLVSLLAEGHVLIEDVPGVGKTMLAKALAKSTGCEFARIQFTPDLLPADILGVNIYNQKTGIFEFRPGPIHNRIILADEINRATPKTQSALLEAMEEKQVTIDGVTSPLPRPFMVMATQNPIEYEGTFPLPESQLDRFFARVSLGYPDEKTETDILSTHQFRYPIEEMEQVVTIDDILEMQKKTREIFVEETLRTYIVRIVQQTRREESLFLGASPRGSLFLFRGAQAEAFINGRDYVIPDDIKKIARLTLCHRLISKNAAYSTPQYDRIIENILEQVSVPE